MKFRNRIPLQANGRLLAWVLAVAIMGFQVAPARAETAPAYSQYVSPKSPAIYEPERGDFFSQFVSPSGRQVTVVVKAPVPLVEYDVPPRPAQQTVYDYLNDALYDSSGAPRQQTTIKFPKSTYDIDFPLNSNCTSPTDHQPKYVHWQLPSGASDLVIDGQGSTVNFSDFCLGLNLPNVTRVTFKNFTFAWPKLRIATIGTIVAVGGNGDTGYTYDVRIAPTDAADLPKMAAATTAWDKSAGHWDLINSNDDVSYGDGVTPGSGVALICAEAPAARAKTGCTVTGIPSYGVQFKVGETVLLRHYNFAAAITLSGQDVTFENVTLQNLISTGFVFSQGRGLHIIRSALERMPGRPISGTGNASIFTGAVTGDVVIEQSSFGYQGDDAFDMNTPIVRFTPTAVTNTTPMATYPFDAATPNQLSWPASNVVLGGDTLALFDNALRFQGLAKIQSVTVPVNGATSTLTLAQTIGLPLRQAGFIAADLTSSAGARYVIRDNSFLFNRARALLLQTPYGLVEGNRFVGQTLKQVYMLASQYWGEGPGAQEILVRDNLFDGRAHGPGFYSLDLIQEAADFPNAQNEVAGSQTAAPPINQNILVSGNVFVSDSNIATVNLSSASNVTFDRNIFLLDGRTAHPLAAGASGPTGQGPVSIHDASNILFNGDNIYSPNWFAQSCAQSGLLDLSNPPPTVSIVIPVACGVRATVSKLGYQAP